MTKVIFTLRAIPSAPAMTSVLEKTILGYPLLIIGILLVIVFILLAGIMLLLIHLKKVRENVNAMDNVAVEKVLPYVNKEAEPESTIALDTETDTPSRSDAFMNELYSLMEKELANSEFSVQQMAEMMHVSRTKLYYKVKDLTGENPSVLLKRYKLQRAVQLLAEGRYNISETADMTGFSTLSHFSISFKKEFGVSPSEYIK